MHAEPDAGQTELVHSLFALAEDYPALEAEARQLVVDLEARVQSLTSYEDSLEAQMGKTSQLVASTDQIKRLGLELRLAGDYKQRPEFATYTDLNVRFFSLRTQLDLLQTHASEPDAFDGV